MTEISNGSFILKQEFSAARTLHVRYEIDWPAKTIDIQLQTNSGKDLMNPEALVTLAKSVLPQRFGITAYDSQVEENHRPVCSTWQLRLNFAGLRLPVRLIRDLSGHITTEILAPTP